MKRVMLALVLGLVCLPMVAFAAPVDEKCFAQDMAAFEKYAHELEAMVAWFEALPPADQATYKPQYDAAVAKLAAMEEALVAALFAQLDQNKDTCLYHLFNKVKGMLAIDARKIFGSLIRKLSARVNMDYVSDPSSVEKAKRARDLAAVRAYIGL